MVIILFWSDISGSALNFFLLGICGTLMSGLALLLREQGHSVSGCDSQFLPPMGDLLKKSGIDCRVGYEAADLPPADCYVIGNALSRGNPMVELILRERLPMTSAPALLRDRVLQGRRVIAVSGTHGKTTVTTLLASMLEQSGLQPGWLIGGVPVGGMASARLGAGELFVLEADEYDTAFFDKSAKFLHYWPDVLLINNLEFDHSDIYPDLAAIQNQFHRLIRQLPDSASLVVPADSGAVSEVLQRGCWSNVETFAGAAADWTLKKGEGNQVQILKDNVRIAEVNWKMTGYHSINNLLAAFATAVAAGADATSAAAAASEFNGVKRRYELLLDMDGVRLYEDFAHHPAAIAACIAAARPSLSRGGRLLAAVDLASNSMRAGSHLELLGQAVAGTDLLFWHGSAAEEAAGRWGGTAFLDSGALSDALLQEIRPGDLVILFSNADFGGLRRFFPERLKRHLKKNS